MPKRTTTNLIVVHCSATVEGNDIGFAEIDEMHKNRGFLHRETGIHCGYHEIIRLDGTIELGRPLDQIGAHAKGFNSRSIGICLVGGIAADGEAEDTFTSMQRESLLYTLLHKRRVYKDATILGHRDLSPDLNNDGVITPDEYMKECPCFSVKEFIEHHGFN